MIFAHIKPFICLNLSTYIGVVNKNLLEEKFSDHPHPVMKGIIDSLLYDAPSGCVLLGQRNVDQVNIAITLGGILSKNDVEWIKSLYKITK